MLREELYDVARGRRRLAGRNVLRHLRVGCLPLQRRLTHVKAVAEAASSVLRKYGDFSEARRNHPENKRAAAIDTRLAMMDLLAASAFVADTTLGSVTSKFLFAVKEAVNESDATQFEAREEAVAEAMDRLMDTVAKAFGREVDDQPAVAA